MNNWRGIFNRLWKLIDASGESYFGGPRFIGKIQEISDDYPPYGELMDLRRSSGKSTSRKDYFYDLLMDLDEVNRARVVTSILDEVGHVNKPVSAEIRALMQGVAAVPNAVVPLNAWNADRLNGYLSSIDDAITAGQFDRAVTVSYTCLEGFYKAFYRAKGQGQPPNDLTDLAKWIWNYLRGTLAEYPEEVLALIKTTAHAVDRARNKFSESHFDGEAAKWLATYLRDRTNTQIRLLLHF